MPRLVAALACLLVTFAAAGSADGSTIGKISQAHAQHPPLTLEQKAYRFWGARLETACPNGSLKFRYTLPPWDPQDDDQSGASWGDCHPYLQLKGQKGPEICTTALHETGHEVGLGHYPGTGNLMDPTRLIIGSRGFLRRHGRWVRGPTVWTGVPAICQPGR